MNRFEGSSGIGSADLFGDGENSSYSGGYVSQMPEMATIRDSMRMGASKVAGKLSSLSNSVAYYLAVSEFINMPLNFQFYPYCHIVFSKARKKT